MPLNHVYHGEYSAVEYTLPASPWVTSSYVTTGSIVELDFQYITRYFVVKNCGSTTDTFAVAFTAAGFLPQNSNYFILSGSESFSAEMRTTKLFLSAAAGTVPYTVVAGITSIPQQFFNTVTGSSGFPAVG